MKMRLYPKLALTGIGKNRQLYFPYILTCIGMVMMFYIMQSISFSPILKEVRGGSSASFILALGRFVIAAFSLLFLLYTNSFLIRRRNKEFGLYNILGMDKGGIARIAVWETVFVFIISMSCGLILGIALSKLGELGLLNAIRAEIDYNFTVSSQSIAITLCIYAAIFVLLLIKTLWQLSRQNPLELMHSENTGEKPPKANWVLALLGFIILATAYYLAVSIKEPMTALVVFFAAVIMVIVATYMLFTAGSVAICKALQKKKGYYYKKNHFVSISSMAYRMKRNGAGLASICILSTMVLVMIASSGSLYIGADDMLRDRYPYDSELSVYLDSLSDTAEEKVSGIRSEYKKVFDEYGVEPLNAIYYSYAGITGIQTGSTIDYMASAVYDFTANYDDLRMLIFVKEADYNRLMGTDISLNPGEAMVYLNGCKYDYDTISIADFTLNIVGSVDSFFEMGTEDITIVPYIFLIVSDLDVLEPMSGLADYNGNKALQIQYYYGCDFDTDDETKIAVHNDQRRCIGNTFVAAAGNGYRVSSSCYVSVKDDFFGTFGGLFFLGIMLSIVFICAAALIIYYKQISEGYEDQSRFDIMQKVGMTKRDIRKSINSQVLTVFFAPLFFAGMHLAFAFPLVWKLLQLFYLTNLRLVIIVAIGAFVLFSVFYAVIYKLTAASYFKIVSGAQRD